MGELAGKTAFVTGASGGIGAAASRALAAAGATVVAVSRSLSEVRAVADSITAAGGNAAAVACDVGRYGDVLAAVGKAVAAYGRLDILINNAGVIEPISRLESSDPEAWDANVRINLMGVYHGVRAALPHLRAAGGGTILNISSGAAHQPLEGWSAYCASKAAVAMLTRVLHLEEAANGIRVFEFGPGTVDTDMQTKIRASQINPVSQIPREELVPAENPAKVIAWLCTAAAADLGGQVLNFRDEMLRRRAGLIP